MHKVLDAARIRYQGELDEARRAVRTVEGVALIADIRAGETTFEAFVEGADAAVFDDAFRRAGRTLSPDLARTYAEHLAKGSTDADFEDALVQARIEVAALGSLDQVRRHLEDEATMLADSWLDQHRVAIKSLPADRQEEYRQIRAMSSEPQDVGLGRSRSWLVASRAREADGTEAPLPTYASHLMCDAAGNFPAVLNAWEKEVLAREAARSGFAAWYRNPPRATPESLGIAYTSDGTWRIVRPDFLFFAKMPDGTIVADLIDPHGTQLSDALPKLRGLARYAEAYAGVFRRIEAVAKVVDNLRALDLTDPKTWLAVGSAHSALELYAGPMGRPY